MLAVIESGSKQYLVNEGDELLVEKLQGKEGGKVKVDRVLLVIDGKEVSVGQPEVKKAKITAKLLTQEKGPKITVFKFKRRKKMRRKIGHRQQMSRLQIEKIELA